MPRSVRRTLSSLWHMQFVRNILTLQAGSFFGSGISFLKSIVFFRLLGVEGFGVYAVVLAFTGTVGIFTNLGQNQAALTFFAESYGKKDQKSMRTVMQYYGQLAVFAFLILVGFAIVSPILGEWLYDSVTIGRIARVAFLALAIGSFDTLFTIVLQTTREIRNLAVLENVNNILQFLLGSAMLLLDFGPIGIFSALCISNAFMLCTYMMIYTKLRKRYTLPTLRSVAQERLETQPFFIQGFWIAIDKNVGNLFPQAFFFLMSLFSVPALVGIAQLAFKIAALPRTLFIPNIVRMSATVLADMHVRGSTALRNAAAKILKHTFFLHALISFGAMIVLPPLSIVIYGWEVSDAIVPMLWLILLQIISGLNVVNAPLFRLMHKAHIPALWGMISLPISLGTLWILLHFLPPLSAFVWSVLMMYMLNLRLNWYLYTELKKPVR